MNVNQVVDNYSAIDDFLLAKRLPKQEYQEVGGAYYVEQSIKGNVVSVGNFDVKIIRRKNEIEVSVRLLWPKSIFSTTFQTFEFKDGKLIINDGDYLTKIS